MIYFLTLRYDGFDCPDEIPDRCNIDLLKNNVCDEKVNTTQCFADLGTCEVDPWLGNFYLCLKNEKLRGDKLCDKLNNMKECGFDNGDCDTSQGNLTKEQ